MGASEPVIAPASVLGRRSRDEILRFLALELAQHKRRVQLSCSVLFLVPIFLLSKSNFNIVCWSSSMLRCTYDEDSRSEEANL